MFYEAKVKVKIEDDKGKIKNKVYVHLVKDSVISGVEDRITKTYTGSVNDWELISVKETKVTSVVLSNQEISND